MATTSADADPYESFRRSINSIHSNSTSLTSSNALTRQHSISPSNIRDAPRQRQPMRGRRHSADIVGPSTGNEELLGHNPSSSSYPPMRRRNSDSSPPRRKGSLNPRPTKSIPCNSNASRGIRPFQRKVSSCTQETQHKPDDSPRTQTQDHEGTEDNPTQIRGYRSDYSLGDTIRSLSDMILEEGGPESLNNYEFAFIKRSNGEWTYAIHACRSFEMTRRCKYGTERSLEECMNFVVDESGAIKTIEKKYYAEYIRMVAKEVPKRLTFPTNLDDDDASVLSDVSELKP